MWYCSQLCSYLKLNLKNQAMHSFRGLSASLYPKFLEGRIWGWFIFECFLMPGISALHTGVKPIVLEWMKEGSLNRSTWTIDRFSWWPCDLKGTYVEHCIVCKHFHTFIDTQSQEWINLFYCWGKWSLEKLWDSFQIFWFPSLWN